MKRIVEIGLETGLLFERDHLRYEEKMFAEEIIKETLQAARAGLEFGPSMEEAVYTYFDIKR